MQYTVKLILRWAKLVKV